MDEIKTANKSIEFLNSNYPKSFGSIKKNDFRLRDFLDLNDKDLAILWKKLRHFCISRAKKVKPRTKYKDLEYIGSGWEWSVFKKDEKTVIKVPAEIFPEINEPIYLENLKKAYKTIRKKFPTEFVANSKFYRKEGLNIEEQEFIKGEADAIVSFETKDVKLLLNLKVFLECCLKIIEENEWLPDFRFLKSKSGFLLRNVILEDETNRPVIIDFTLYFDPNHLYPKMKKTYLYRQKRRILKLLNWTEQQLGCQEYTLPRGVEITCPARISRACCFAVSLRLDKIG